MWISSRPGCELLPLCRASAWQSDSVTGLFMDGTYSFSTLDLARGSYWELLGALGTKSATGSFSHDRRCLTSKQGGSEREHVMRFLAWGET